MNTHKEKQAPTEWLLDDLLVTILDSSPEELVGLHSKLEALAESIQERKSELAPLEPKEECEHMLVSGPFKCIKCGDLVEPTPPSQIEEEPKRTLAQAISDPEFMDRVVKEWAKTMEEKTRYYSDIAKAKEHFEANLLDGDKVEDSGNAMLDAKDVWEYFLEVLKDNTK